MTHKEIAERLRSICDESTPLLHKELVSLADQLDPPRPEPGTVVRWAHVNDTGRKYLGYAVHDGVASLNHPESVRDNYVVAWENIEWKPARILADDEVPVKVPPVSEWPEWADYLEGKFHNSERQQWCDALFITRAEAEKMEAEG